MHSGDESGEESDASDLKAPGLQLPLASPRSLAPALPASTALRPSAWSPRPAAAGAEQTAIQILREVCISMTGAEPCRKALDTFRGQSGNEAWWIQVRMESSTVHPSPSPLVNGLPFPCMQAAEKRRAPHGLPAWFIREGFEAEFRAKAKEYVESEWTAQPVRSLSA